MQRINFTETTLTTLKRNARCSFANAVYKLTMKAQQGLKCDDLFKKSVLMNEVNKLLCKYKLDECISFHPFQEGGISSWYFGIGSFTGTITYNLIIDGVETFIGSGSSVENIVIDINNNTEGTGVTAELGEGGYFRIYSPAGCFIKADLTGIIDPEGAIPATQVTFLAGKCPQVETCVDYTEEELNCITPQDLQLLFEFTHKYKETLAKSTKRITSPSTSSSSPSPSDCCNWGSIGGSIGNQSDLVAYLNTIEKNFISVYDETTEITGDLKSLKFLGAGVTATNSGGNVSVTIPGGGSGGTVMIELTNAELITLLGSNSITKGVIYRVMDAIDGIVQVVGRGSNSVNRAAYREGRGDNTLLQFMGIFGNYTPSTNTFLEQGRIATEPTVNEDFVHGYYVGQELKTLDTGLTYVCTDSTNTSAVWTLVPGGGGSQDLAQVLAVGNTSGANDIEFDVTQGLLFSNTSRLREGTTDAGLGGNKGIAEICGIGFESKWEAGRRYIMGSSGSTIRQSLYNFTTIPTSNEDTTKGYAIGSLWTLDDGTTYECTDDTIGSAVWVNRGNAFIVEIGFANLAALETAGTLSLTTIYIVTDATYRIALQAEAANKIGANGTIIDLTYSGSVYYDLATNTIVNGTMSDIGGNIFNGCLPTDVILGADCFNNTFGQGANGFTFGDDLKNVTIEAGITGADYSNTTTYAFLYNKAYSSTIFQSGGINYHRYFDIANDRIEITDLATPANITYIGGGGSGTVTSVGLSMPSAFSVASSPVTTSGTIAVTGAGLTSQYVRGDGTLANFPNSTGGGSSVNYYLNGSVSQGTFGGDIYYQMSKTPILGAGTNFTRTNGAGNGYIASFITDAGDPSFLNIPAGNWNLEFYFQSSATGGSPQFYGEIYKVSATNVFTLVASGSANPEGITNGTTVDQYFTSIPVPQTSLLITDRLAIRIYVITGGRTITLHTENGNLCEVLTTFTTGLTALNGLTEQVQTFAVGTTGSDFAISSASGIHNFNLPTASASNRGALSSADWSAFNGKQDTLVSGTNIKTVEGSTLLGSAALVISREIQLACSDETTALTTGAAKVTFRAPRAMVITGVRASLTTAQTSGSIFTVDINESGTSILSTKLTIDNTEKTSVTAATPAVISDTAIADDAEITIDIDQIGDGTAKGLKITILYTI